MTDRRAEPPRAGASRRTVTKAIAWSIPIIAIAAPAPAFAASGVQPIIVPGQAAESPGNSCKVFVKGYVFPFTVTNPDPTRTIYLTDATISATVTGLALAGSYPPLPVGIAPGETTTVYINASSGNSANQTFSAHLVIMWGYAADGSQPGGSEAFDVDVPDTPPVAPCPTDN